MISENEALELVRTKKLRIVSAARKRKLRKKGVSVRWMSALNAYVWEPKF